MMEENRDASGDHLGTLGVDCKVIFYRKQFDVCVVLNNENFLPDWEEALLMGLFLYNIVTLV